MPDGNDGRGPRQRREERFGLPVRVRVGGGHDVGGTPWEEVTLTRDASAGGASFLIDHPLSVGEVVRVQVLPPLPVTMRAFALMGPSRPVYAIVRSSILETRGRRVGVKFFDDVEGLMPPSAPGPPLGTEDRRLRERYLTSVHFVAQRVDEYGAVLTEALTVAENVSGGGAQLLAPIHVIRGDTLMLLEAGGPFASRAEVRNTFAEEDGLRRLNVMFLDGRSPGHLFPPAPDPTAAAMLAPALALSLLAAGPAAAAPADPAMADRFARLALACVAREYPNKIAHVLSGDLDVKPPRELTPAFFGCYDWHSAVHGHWLLARLARTMPEAPFAAEARAALGRSLTVANIAAEVRYLEGKGRASFERPYGLAWLLQLAAELRGWPSAEAGAWSEALEPLERAAAARIADWLPKLTHPIRVGEHSQTAFAFGLILDWARGAGDAARQAGLESRIRELYAADRACPLAYEPSGEDFLSPCLAEADLMRRILAPREYAAWLRAFLPALPGDGSARWLAPAVVTDPTDPKLAHLDGLNLSRAWMLEGMAAGLPAGDRRLASLRAAAAAHRGAGLRAVTGEHYEGGHWLGTFAVYLVTGRGLPASAR